MGEEESWSPTKSTKSKKGSVSRVGFFSVVICTLSIIIWLFYLGTIFTASLYTMITKTNSMLCYMRQDCWVEVTLCQYTAVHVTSLYDALDWRKLGFQFYFLNGSLRPHLNNIFFTYLSKCSTNATASSFGTSLCSPMSRWFACK